MKTILISISVCIVSLFAGYKYAYYINSSETTVQLPKNKIKVEYYLEVSEDSIQVQSMYGKVYKGKYSDLDSLIIQDNL